VLAFLMAVLGGAYLLVQLILIHRAQEEVFNRARAQHHKQSQNEVTHGTTSDACAPYSWHFAR